MNQALYYSHTSNLEYIDRIAESIQYFGSDSPAAHIQATQCVDRVSGIKGSRVHIPDRARGAPESTK
jgi:hypothetical protein